MKGTTIENDVLKIVILDSISQSRATIRVFNDCIKTFPDMSNEFHLLIEHEQTIIRKEMQELIELKRRRARQAIYKAEQDEKRSNEMRERLRG